MTTATPAVAPQPPAATCPDSTAVAVGVGLLAAGVLGLLAVAVVFTFRLEKLLVAPAVHGGADDLPPPPPLPYRSRRRASAGPLRQSEGGDDSDDVPPMSSPA